MLTVGSLFAGAGGLDLGLEQTGGFRTVWQCEIDPYCRRVLAKHWPEVRRWDDVRTFPPEPVDEWRCDLVTGGDPCQENSRARYWDAGTKSLGSEFLRVVAAIRPRLVLRENPSAVRADAPWPWWRFRAGLESIGYACVPFRLRACCVGARHQRERLFVFGELADANSNGLEGRARGTQNGQAAKLPRLLDGHDWPQIPAARGFRSRAGLPAYVDRMRAIGNAVVPAVAQWIGERIIEAID